MSEEIENAEPIEITLPWSQEAEGGVRWTAFSFQPSFHLEHGAPPESAEAFPKTWGDLIDIIIPPPIPRERTSEANVLIFKCNDEELLRVDYQGRVFVNSILSATIEFTGPKGVQ